MIKSEVFSAPLMGPIDHLTRTIAQISGPIVHLNPPVPAPVTVSLPLPNASASASASASAITRANTSPG